MKGHTLDEKNTDILSISNILIVLGPNGILTVAFALDSNQAASSSHVADVAIGTRAPTVLPLGDAKGRKAAFK